jgi:hypothetical protein
VALISTRRSWYYRAAKPEARMEAITSRGLLLAAVGRATRHAGKTTLYLSPMHAAKTTLMRLIANIRAALGHVKKVAEQYPAADRWRLYRGQNHPSPTPETPRNPCPAGRVTAVFRITQ